VLSRTSSVSILVALIVSCFLPASRALAEGPRRDPCPTWYADCDGDTFFKVSGIVSCVEPTTDCLDGQAPDGGWTNGLPGSPDCDDEDPSEYPGQDWYADCDGDGSFSSAAVVACDAVGADALTPCSDASPPDGGWSHIAGSDCDDADVSEFPGQDWYADCDGDGSFSSAAVVACDAAEADALTPCSDASPPDGGWSHIAGSDCDDADVSEFPGQDWYADCDGDGSFSSQAVVVCDAAEADATTPCIDASPPDGGWSHTAGSDCDDADASEYPGQDWYADCDGDGSFSSQAVVACDAFEADASSPCYDSYPPDGGWGNFAGSDCDDEDVSLQVIDACGICGGDNTNCEIFADDFESGGTTRWSVSVP